MSVSMNKERMNSVFQEAKARGLSEPDPNVDHRGYPTLTWVSGTSEITLVFTAAPYLKVLMDETMNVDFNLASRTDAEIVDRVAKEIAKAAK